MKTKTFRQSVVTATVLLMSSATFAQEGKQFEIAPAADLVSSYVWRGVYQTGPSVQPSIALSYAGVSLTAWGSTDFSSISDPDKGKEFDLTLGYGIGGFSIGVTDYWWAGEGKRYGNYSNSHYYEGRRIQFRRIVSPGDHLEHDVCRRRQESGWQTAVLHLRGSRLCLQRIGSRRHPKHRRIPLDRDVSPRRDRRFRPLDGQPESKQGNKGHRLVLAPRLRPMYRSSQPG